MEPRVCYVLSKALYVEMKFLCQCLWRGAPLHCHVQSCAGLPRESEEVAESAAVQ